MSDATSQPDILAEKKKKKEKKRKTKQKNKTKQKTKQNKKETKTKNPNTPWLLLHAWALKTILIIRPGYSNWK